ncbi:TPA: phage tail protein [Clostridioides difficile]|nr:phage tail protein [Clostridioides difficile]
MLFILDKTERIVGVLSNRGDINKVTPFFDDTHSLDLDNGSESYEFSTLADAPESKHIEIGNYIAFDFRGEVKLFTIVDITEDHNETHTKTVYCETCGLELLNSYVRPREFTGVNIQMVAEALLQDTSFKLGTVSLAFNDVMDVSVSKAESVYKLIQDVLIGQFGAEVSFRIKLANNRIVGKYLDLHYKRGRRDLYRFEYGVNMTSVSRRVDASNLATALIGVGNNNLDFKSVQAEDKPLNQDFIVNQEAYERFNVRGRHIYGVYEYSTDSPDELLKMTREESKLRGEPKITYEMDLELLGHTVELGDTVYVIDNDFTPPLHLEARVQKLELSKSNPTGDKCTLANFKEVQSKIDNEEIKALSDKLVYISNKFEGTAEELRDKIEAIQVGGRNLILDSVRKVTNTSYPTAIFSLSQEEPFIDGAEYTLTIKGQLGEGKRHWSITGLGGTIEYCTITEKDRRPDGRYVKTFNWLKGDDLFLEIYPVLASVDSESTIEWVKLEFGNVASAHSYAQEDLDQVVDDKLNGTETILNQNIDNAVKDSQDTILESVADNYANKVTITQMESNLSSKIEQTNKDLTLNFTRVNDYTAEIDGELTTFKKEVGTHIRFSEDGMELGKVDSPFTATLDNTKLAFYDHNNEVAYISNNKMYITQAEITNNLKIGNKNSGFFTWQEGTGGNLSLKWSRE